MPYSAKAIANLLLDVAREHGGQVDQMKLQKLVYISHGWNLAINGQPLINDDIQAWQYGPVIPNLYHEFKNCGRNSITDYATELEVVTDNLSFSFKPPKVDEGDIKTIELVRKIWEVYGGFTGPQLSNLTHMPDTPWDKIYRSTPKGSIPNHLIQEHFVGLSQNRNAG